MHGSDQNMAMDEAPRPEDADHLREGEEVAGMDRPAVQRAMHELDTRPLDAFPLFMQDLPPADEAAANIPLQALQSLLYEGTPADQALNFKNQGNECFLLGPSGYHDALRFYTRGLETQCGDAVLEATLHSNRAAVHLGLGNWGDALRDAKRALQLDPATTQVKAHKRIIRAALRLGRAEEARSSVEALRVLGQSVDGAIEEELAALEARLAIEADKQRQREAGLEKIRQTIGDCRGVRVEAGVDAPLLEHFGPSDDVAHRLPTVTRDPRSKRRVWPVLLLYPAAAQSDLLDKVDEDCRFASLLATVFRETPAWDDAHIYRNASNLQVFWHDPSQRERIVCLSRQRTIGDLLGTLITRIERGVLPFYVVPERDVPDLLKRFPLQESF